MPAAEAELRLKFKDVGTVSGIDKVAKRVEQITKKTEDLAVQSNARQRTSFERLSLAREQLGMRSEQKIQREIQQTEAAYKRLASSGKLSQDELTRAAEKTRQKITTLTNEMGKLTAEQQKAAKAAKDFETAQGRIRTGVAVGAGVAAGYALKSPVMNAMSMDERLASLANTAFRERDVTGRLAGTKELEAAINKSVDLKRGGGGTREQALDALEKLASKDALGSADKAMSFLPTVMRTAYGSGANPLDIADLVSALVGQGIAGNEGELKRALNMVTASGQAGGFEIKDMARALPGQLAVGKTAGLVGLPGLQKILTMNQAAIMTAGDTSTAGNNVLNLLTKLSSSDTAKDFDKAGGGDLNKFLIDQRLKGIDAVDAWLNLIDKLSMRDPQMKSALAKLQSAGNKADQQAAIESISQLAEGGIIGRFFQDMQARGALFGMRNTALTERVGGFISRNNTEVGANDLNYQTMAGTGAAALRNAEQEMAIRQKEAMERLIPTISKAADIFVDLSQKYPDLSAAVVGATPPIIALGTAAGISALALGGKSGGAIGRYAMRAAAFGASALGVGAAGGVGYAVGDQLIKPGIDKLVQWGSGRSDATLGTAIYDYMIKPSSVAPQKSEVHLTIESTAPGFMVKQKTKSDGVSVTTKGNTGNIFDGAPR
ncbi:phage tail tape measure protein [Methylomonas sp. MS20]|uniref:phage tail tape measure protein n=1 Tax=unclassified Methylomonas TaxID=2608980 RepID=UPI0028A3530E|nr:phage tail tape measure protein [Methylomonas sp. MV1]MDT4328545.1 phage tail tape measure protein [Methylomonas sp. MV1]